MNNLNVIVEGLDNTGKTTLIQNLKNVYNDKVIQNLHFSNVKQKTNSESIRYSTALYTQMFEMMNENRNFICDRSHIGEMVYSPLYRNYSGDFVLDIERKFNDTKMWSKLILIMLIDEPENLLDRDDGLSISDKLDDKKTEIELFKESFKKSSIRNKLILNVKDLSIEEVKTQVVHFIDLIDECVVQK